MKFPKFINKDDTIYLISTSLGCSTEPYKTRLDNAITFLRQNNELILGESVYQNINALANTPKKMGEEFEKAYLSNSNFLLSVGGGELQALILDYINFDKIKTSTPKWFMGYSDNTNLCFALTVKCDIASIYGAHAPQFGYKILDQSLLDNYDLMFGKKLSFSSYPKYEIEQNEDPYLGLNLQYDSVISTNDNDLDISFKGRIIGGCLDVLTTLVGTEYGNINEFNEKYKEDGIIWYLESCELNTMAVIRQLIHLKRNNWFKYIKGFIIGRPMLINDSSFGINMKEAFMDTLKEFNVPIIYGADIGHLNPSIPVINGSICEVNYNNKKLKVSYYLV